MALEFSVYKIEGDVWPPGPSAPFNIDEGSGSFRVTVGIRRVGSEPTQQFVYLRAVNITGDNVSGVEPFDPIGFNVDTSTWGSVSEKFYLLQGIVIVNDSIRELNDKYAIVISSMPTGTTYLASLEFTIIDDDPYHPDDDFADSLTDIKNAMGAITAGAMVSANLATAGDKDFFAVTLIAGTTYSIGVQGQVTNAGTLIDPMMTLYDASGTAIVTDDDSGALGKNALVSYKALTTGTYYIAASASNSTATGTYRVNVDAVAVDDYADTITGTSLTIGSIVAGQKLSGSIETGGDKDLFRIDLTEATTLAIGLEGAASRSGTLYDPFVSLYDSNGVLILANDDDGVGNNALLRYTAVAGTYYIEARSFNTVNAGTYQLSVGTESSTGGSGGAGDDHGSTAATAGTAVQNGGFTTGNIETAADKDWFTVQMSAGTTYTIALDGAYNSGGTRTLYDPFVSLLNAVGTVVLGSDDDSGPGNNALLRYTAAVDGTYLVEARSVSAVSTGTYRLTVSASSSAPSSDIPADASTSATLAVDGKVSGTVDAGGDKDWFAVSLQAGTTYSIALKGSSSAAGTLYDPFVSLYSGTQRVGFNDDDGTGRDALLVYTPETSGTYYVEAGSYGASGAGTYEVSVFRGAGDGPTAVDDYGSTHVTESLPIFFVGGKINGNIESAGDKDWFRVVLSAATNLTIALDGAATAAGTLYDPFVTLYNSDGSQVLGSNDDDGMGNNALLSYNAGPGTYFIEARSFSANGLGTYQMSLTLGGASSSADDFPASPGTTGDLGSGGKRSGVLEAAGDKDWFRVTLQQGSTYSIAVDGASSRAGTLYDPLVSLYLAGVRVASDDDSGVGKNSLATFTASQSGTYYVEAGSFSASGTGTYEVSVQLVGI